MLIVKKRLSKISALMRKLKKEHQKLTDDVLNRLPSKKKKSLKRQPKSVPSTSEVERKRRELEEKLPELVTTTEAIDTIGTTPSNFYRNVFEQILFPVSKKISKQPRYRRKDVINLAISITHEPGAHTFSKLKKKNKRS